ncbi:hypothetical protein Tsubulata_022550, partial [Turnera subulata]
MNGGEGSYSYANNSQYQKGGVDLANAIIHEEITNKLDVRRLCSSNLFRIADLGCSIGQNTLNAVQNIVKAVDYRFQSQGRSSKDLEYQVFFNDRVSNDFNTLFRSLPPERTYFAAGVPGDFRRRLFPKSSLHFVHSSYGVLWLSKIPKEVQDKDSPAWNKGKIFYHRKEVQEAYAAEFAREMKSFLEARAEELKCGGFMALLLVSVPEGANRSKSTISAVLELLGSCLMDFANRSRRAQVWRVYGSPSNERIRGSKSFKIHYKCSFRAPGFLSYGFCRQGPSEVETLIQGNGHFKIRRMEEWPRPMLHVTRPNVEQFSLIIRAAFERLIREHFGDEIVDQLFDRFTAKLVASSIFSSDSSYLPMKRGVDLANIIIHEEITNNLDVKQLCPSNLFNIVDLGCSIGQNTLNAVQNIVKAVDYRFHSQGMSSKDLEYQVFFNDQVSNDFNTLFKSLPLERTYFAAGVPGDFRGRLFPKSSMHFVHSSYALLWLSDIPKEVQDKDSPAWNKGKIFHQRKEVQEAYAAEFAREMESFLEARAEELKCGGFMALLFTGIQEGATCSKSTIVAVIHLLGSCLMDLANMGFLDEAKVDSFNIPLYHASPLEVEKLIQRNMHFKIRRMEEWPRPMLHVTRPNVEQFSLIIRAAFERLIREHFGDEIVDQLFDRFTAKLVASSIFSSDSSYLPMTLEYFIFSFCQTFLSSGTMNGGEGPYSYANNSDYQKGGVDLAKAVINEEITNKLDLKRLVPSNSFSIADLGCSIGQNTLNAVQNIVKAVDCRFQSQGMSSKDVEYQVFFNDQFSNDFNTLFRSLPPESTYFAAGVPGDFRGRLFPKGSLDFVHSSYAVMWLSTIPKEVQDKNLLAWNKGKIFYHRKEVQEAYAAEFAREMESFLEARAEELKYGGLMALLLVCAQEGADHSKSRTSAVMELLASCLMDFANMGLLDEAKVDSFNMPSYYAYPSEVETIVQGNGHFKIQRMEKWSRPIPDFQDKEERKSWIIRSSIFFFPVLSAGTMNGGEGPYSYANNSGYQKGGVDLAEALIHEEITNKLNLERLDPSNSFSIADLGCSIGQNTLNAVQNIVKAVDCRFQSQGMSSKDLEYQVFFNDQVSNDFNTLFRSLPLAITYFAAGVPGDFHGRLFPKGSLDFVHSSYAVMWLSTIPKEVQDKDSPAWNKGKIFYHRKEVQEAYAAEFAREMETFLEARAEELRCGGFMALLLACAQEGAGHSKSQISGVMELLASCLMDFANMGLVDEAKVDSFNVPLYYAYPSEVETLIQGNGHFKIQRMEKWSRQELYVSRSHVEQCSLMIRAVLEGLIREHFGDEVVDQLFEQFTEKLIESSSLSDSSYGPMVDLFVLLERI